METLQTTPQPLTSGRTPPPEEIRTQIEKMRGDMSATIDGIQGRPQPSDLVGQAVTPAMSAAQDATSGAMDTVVETVHTATNATVDTLTQLLNVLRSSPALMAALPGLIATLLASGRSTAARAEETVEQTVERAGNVAMDAAMALWEAIGQNPALKGALVSGVTWALAQGTNMMARAGQMQQKAGDLTGYATEQASETASDLAGRARETAGQVGAQSQQQAQRAATWLQHTVEQDPLVVALAAVVIGAAIGLSSEPSQLEHRVMGPARDRLLEQAQTMAKGLAGIAVTNMVTHAVTQAGTPPQNNADVTQGDPLAR
jgi:hypothetical protein